MRVNVMGKGVCPVLGSILPIVNVDIDEGTLLRLVNTRTIRVFDAITGLQITSRNYKNIIMSRVVAPKAQVETPVEPVKVSPNPSTAKKKSTKKSTKEEAPATVEAVPEVAAEETPSEPVEAPVEVQSEPQPETPETETPAETTDTTDDTTEDSSAETESEDTEQTTYSSKKKKRR
jgi:hypothetical protein